MADPIEELADESAHHGAHHASNLDRYIGLMITIFAFFLALSEMQGKSAQTEALTLNIQISDTWNFFQAKTLRQTIYSSFADFTKFSNVKNEAEAQKQIESWVATADRYESDPKSNEGRKELMERAKHMEHDRDHALGKYHAFETASLVIQLSIVLSSVAILSSIMLFAGAALVLGLGGITMFVGVLYEIPFVMNLLH
jgi:Domain of unknown function (DUF4337)